MEPTKLYNIFEKHRYNLDEVGQKSKAWYEQQALLLAKKRYTPPMVMRDDPSQLKSRIIVGRLYMFVYDPKTKETLPYYDRFPLVFPFERKQDGFLGLNLHYLPYQLRIRLLTRLMVLASNQKMDDTTRLKLSWQLLSGASKFALAKPCVKRYLLNHVRSQFREVEAQDWATAMLLPVERFRRANPAEVWADSRKKV